ncbi:copper amine oxidase domain protein [Clostridium cellulovorans 743B]|uniref:Copper amine oxidase domain protein n=1 Tax=Clostridium cellulovorans (strain ATCC 35296 / DSM 3052 / OCM 3 / 743B) TaxID=573061 RepID=D9SRE4_CLOC7|nr:copper amine oxidase domain protein [Clostridium cellulovorans 743B]
MSLVYFVFSMHVHFVETLRIQKYGRGVFTISSNKYRKSLKGKKEFTMIASPVKSGESIYLPLKTVAKLVGARVTSKDDVNKLKIRYYGKIIYVTNENTVAVRDTAYRDMKSIKDAKVSNDEVLLPIETLRRMFGVKIDIENNNIILR